MRAVIVLAALLVGSALPVAADPAADTEALKARVLELQRKSAVSEVEIARLRQEVSRLHQQVEALLGAAALKTPAAPAPAKEAPAPAAATPPGAIEVGDLEEPVPPVAAAAKDAGLAPVTPPAQAAYDEAYTLYHQGRYGDAEASFLRFLQAYPRTDLTDNALYWIGESRFARGDLRGALAAFRQTIESFPQGNKVPDALLKAGQCLQALGDVDGARASYEELVHRYADSGAAATAQERLSALPH